MQRTSHRALWALSAWLWLGACSGAGPEAPGSGSSAASAARAAGASRGADPAAAAAATTGASSATAGSLPAAAAEGRPAGGGAPPRAEAPADNTVELRNEILRLIGTAACRDDSQCRALPLGSKPCGGAEGYVAWSTAATNARQLEALAAHYKDARQARNQRLGLMSDCAVVPVPAVRCVRAPDVAAGGRCEAGPAARVGPLPATR